MNEQNDSKAAELLETYRWTCPICRETSAGASTEKTPRERAVNALLSHIRVLDGEGHGPAHQLPEELDRETLDQHVRTDVDVERR